MKIRKDKLLNIILPILTVICIIVIWLALSLSVDSEYILPLPSITAKAIINLLGDGEFYVSLLGTLLRSVISFLLSFLIAFLFAFLSKKYTACVGAVKTIIAITRTLPTVAVVLLLIFWTNSFVAPVIVTMLVVLPTLYTNIYNSINSVDNEQLKMCRVYGVSKREAFFKVQLPQIMPSMLLSCGSGLSLNLKLMVAAEVLSATANSLGYLLNTSKAYFEIATMIALVCICVVIGLLIEFVFDLLSKRAGRFL